MPELTRRALLRAGVALGASAIGASVAGASALGASVAAAQRVGLHPGVAAGQDAGRNAGTERLTRSEHGDDNVPGAAQDELEALERTVGGRLGVAVLDTERGRRLSYRADERFPLLSTFKFLAAAQVLARVDDGLESLAARVRFSPDVLVPYSPITQQFAGDAGLTVGELCAAAVGVSDNGAGNLLLARLGGPAGLTAFCRSLGDPVTRLDRIEVELNEATPGDPRDTTSPHAMLSLMEQLLLGDALSPTSRSQLVAWMEGSTTGASRLRARWPSSWRVGDKTGTSMNGCTNDIAIAHPPGRRPLLVAAYLAEAPVASGARDAVLAQVGELARMQLR